MTSRQLTMRAPVADATGAVVPPGLDLTLLTTPAGLGLRLPMTSG